MAELPDRPAAAARREDCGKQSMDGLNLLQVNHERKSDSTVETEERRVRVEEVDWKSSEKNEGLEVYEVDIARLPSEQ